MLCVAHKEFGVQLAYTGKCPGTRHGTLVDMLTVFIWGQEVSMRDCQCQHPQVVSELKCLLDPFLKVKKKKCFGEKYSYFFVSEMFSRFVHILSTQVMGNMFSGLQDFRIRFEV